MMESLLGTAPPGASAERAASCAVTAFCPGESTVHHCLTTLDAGAGALDLGWTRRRGGGWGREKRSSSSSAVGRRRSGERCVRERYYYSERTACYDRWLLCRLLLLFYAAATAVTTISLRAAQQHCVRREPLLGT